MYIRSIHTSGFRSFGVPTDVHLEPGINGIIGPNGCGKTNLLHAIAWGMGNDQVVSNSSALVFKGTETRAKASEAIVRLTLGIYWDPSVDHTVSRSHHGNGASGNAAPTSNSLPVSQIANCAQTIPSFTEFQRTFNRSPEQQIFLIDEIDNELSERERQEFLYMLNELGDQNQIIVASHSKRTMSCCDLLLGITMEEWGVSKQISLRTADD